MTTFISPYTRPQTPTSIDPSNDLAQSIGGMTEVTRGQVKWFNIEKGYGFIVPENSVKDAFLHISVLKRRGFMSIGSGATVTFMMRPGRGGPEVAEVLEIDESTVAEQQPTREQRSVDDIEGLLDDAKLVEGYVKWFNPSKGYGFIVPSDGSRDVFIHMSLLRRHGLENLIPDQKIIVFTVEGPKGPEAIKISEIRHV